MTRWIPLLILMAFAGLTRGHAVILFGTGDPDGNTTPPGGELAGSGWEYQISANAGGTVVGPSHILTARHLGFTSNSVVAFEGLNYRVIEHADAPDSDLRLLRVSGRFRHWAPTLESTNETGRPVVLFGRGGPRGAALLVGDAGSARLSGWGWRDSDVRLRWGTNQMGEIVDGTPDAPGIYLSARFDEEAGADEATVSPGDSGGGVFLRDDDGVWKLAGVLSSVEGAFRRTPDDAVFYAAVFDRRNLLQELEPGVWGLDPERFEQPGAAWFATRVSAYQDWLAVELAREPAVALPRLLSSRSVGGPYEEHPAYSIEVATQRIALFRGPDEGEFYRIEGGPTLRLAALTDTFITLQY